MSVASLIGYMLALGVSPLGGPLVNSDFTQVVDGRFAAWSPVGSYKVEGQAARVECTVASEVAGLVQIVRCDPPLTYPFTASARARCKNVGTGGDFAVWLDLIHTDGSASWAHVAGFSRGTHDWERAQVDVVPAKPVAEIRFHLLLRGTIGRAWFAEPELKPTPLAFRRLEVVRGLWGPRSLSIRAETNLPATIEVEGLPAAATRPASEHKSERVSVDLADAPPTLSTGPVVVRAKATDKPSNEVVATVQARAAGGAATGNVRAWLTDSTTRVFTDSLPEEAKALELDAARCGHVSLQAGLAARPDGSGGNVEVGLLDLDLDGGGERLPATAWQKHRVGYIRNELPARHPALERDGPTWWPDALLPYRPLSIPGGKTMELSLNDWKKTLSCMSILSLPEPRLSRVVLATQAHILMAARTAPDGKSIEPWIASNTYGPLDTEAQAVVLGMDLMGHHDFARRCHEFFISSYNPHGLLAKGYTLMGTGQHLWTLAEHVKLTANAEWFEKIAPQVLRPCDWIKRQLEKTKRNDPAGVPLPESGLMPPGVLADWNRYAYYFYANAHFYAGLHGIADCLARIHHPRAAEIAKLADEYRGHILAAWKWQQARMPVLPLRDGAWAPATPSSLYCYGLTRDFYGGVSATGHDVEVGGNHLIPLGLIAPHSREADWIADYYEDRWFFIDGIFGAYPTAENEADPFNRGGFAKLQPHYARTSDIHALRDDVKPFIRTYFNTFPVLLNTENLTFWEHMNNGGAWNKTHESGWFLQMTRTMLVQERGDELWLAPFVTNNWLRPGTGVKVQNAPTYFGTVSYELKPSADGSIIDADITPPARSAPKSIVLRVRHPEGKRIRRVLVDDAPWQDFDAARETVRLAPSARPIQVRAEY